MNSAAREQPTGECEQSNTRLGRLFWNFAGTFFLVLGIIGIPVPLLPTTPLLLLSAACYLKGSARIYKWLLTNRYFGTYLSDYRSGKGMPMRVKASTLALLWIFIGATTFFAIDNTTVRILLLLIAIGVSVHILTIRTKRRAQ